MIVTVPDEYTKLKAELLFDYYGSYDAMKPFMEIRQGRHYLPPLPIDYQFLLDLEFDPKTCERYKKPINISTLLFKRAKQQFKDAF